MSDANASHSYPQISVPIIGYHRSALTQKFGIPRQPNLVALPSVIELIVPYNTPEAFDGIEQFSHLWISWHTHHNNNLKNHNNHSKNNNNFKTHTANNDEHNNNHNQTELTQQPSAFKPPVFKPKVRPPRLGGNTKLGVFATRSTFRPSQLGLSVVKLERVEVVNSQVRLHISGADMVDGTPIVDIKPYIAYSDALTDAVSGFAPDRPQLQPVSINTAVQAELEQLLSPADIEIICQLIAQDPRPAYRKAHSKANDVDGQDQQRVYFLRYKQFDIGFVWQSADAKFCIVSLRVLD
ncbi:SAM-dependent methyltransferase [Psychrobacter sp. FDAARGOS_221]|uniref:SAM-dependent methyltransferase n=1 Tax=Psychrobacter sp. FDAARGOS_221 TaxID=1975705 RepID=UPI000BB56A58|nr:tRNA (N6-threonylcarbamoyladenosine(37)-N6)-methyltransferase TrmO [Psychrobacter sp. FDAARGOS_221]PNK61914.1 tRNA (N6-threonylcarbamoyladenosine(37)-N6)-methyltransferase TrmO [Psychrobacter sp. FDAARGOS_221]